MATAGGGDVLKPDVESGNGDKSTTEKKPQATPRNKGKKESKESSKVDSAAAAKNPTSGTDHQVHPTDEQRRQQKKGSFVDDKIKGFENPTNKNTLEKKKRDTCTKPLDSNEEQVYHGHEQNNSGTTNDGHKTEGTEVKNGNPDGQTGKVDIEAGKTAAETADTGGETAEASVNAENTDGQTGNAGDETGNTAGGKAGHDGESTDDEQGRYGDGHGNGCGNQGSNNDVEGTDDVKKGSNGEENGNNGDNKGNAVDPTFVDIDKKDDSFYLVNEAEVEEAKAADAAVAGGSHGKEKKCNETHGKDESAKVLLIEPDVVRYDNNFEEDKTEDKIKVSGSHSPATTKSHESTTQTHTDKPSEIDNGKSEPRTLNESRDSDGIEVLGNDNEDDTNTNGNTASVSPPIADMLEHSSLPPEGKEGNADDKVTKKGTKEVNQNDETDHAQTDDEHLNKKTGLATAVKHTEDPPIAKTKGKFTLKPVQERKTYLIKSDACSKPFKYTPKFVDVYIDDDDDLLFDGDNMYKLIVDNGTIKLDALSDAETVNSTSSTMNPPGSQSSPNKTNEFEQVEDNKAHVHDGGADSKSGPAKDDAMEGIANSLTPVEAGCEPSKQSNKNIFCLSGAESNTTPKICVQTFNPKQPSKVTLYSFGCKNMSVFLRWTFALRNKSILKQFSQEYKNVSISCSNDVLVIEDPYEKHSTEEAAFHVASIVVDHIIGMTKNYKIEGIGLDGDDALIILSAIRQSQVYQGQSVVEYYDKDGDFLWVLFHSSHRKPLMDVIDEARLQHKSTDVQFVETLKLDFFWHKLLSGKQFMDNFGKSHRNVSIIHKMVEDNDSVTVTVQSDCKEDALTAKEWIYSKVQNYASASISYKNLNVPSQFETSVVVDEFLQRSFEGNDVRYTRNEKTQNIWIWSESMRQADLDKERNKVKMRVQKNEVIKTLSFLKSKQVTRVTEKLGISEDSALVKISYEDGNAKITGLCHIVDQIRCEVEKGSNSGSGQSGSSPSPSGPKPPPRNKNKPSTSKEPQPPDGQTMDRGDEGTTSPTFDQQQLHEFPSHQFLVCVKKIPKDMKLDDLSNDIKHKMKSSPPKIAFIEGSGEALLMFNNENEVDGFLKSAPQGYSFNKFGKRALSNFSQSVKLPAFIKPDSRAEKNLREDLESIGVTIKGNADRQVIRAPTSYQMRLAQRFLNDFISKLNKPCIITDVPELVWRTVSINCCQTISDIESNCGQKIVFSEDEYQVRLPATDKLIYGRINALKTELENMKAKEIAEMKLTDVEAKNVEHACKELELAAGMNHWLLDKEKKNVYIYGDSFEDLSKYKTQWEIKIGRKKPTARGKRTHAQIVSTSDENKQMPNGQTSAVTLLVSKKYSTEEGIAVSVYKADILRLNVDCIVNAANGDLQHAGGVARVISKHAGPDLGAECKEYIREHGKLSVGQSCSTTAGKLKYKCVVHTVGPAWHDYGRQKTAYFRSDRPYRSKEDCEGDLVLAVLNSFYEAERKGMKTIALPAISSAIFGVPIEICVKQYVRGVQEYSKNKGHCGSPLSEIHFIDINEDTVRAIQKAFSEQLSSFDHDKTCLDRSSDDKAEERNHINDEKPPEPLMFESRSRGFHIHFMGNTDSNKLLLCQKDIETIQNISAVVVPVNERGEGGIINKTISAKVEYKDSFLPEKRRLFESQRRKAREVVEISGYGCGFKYILYAVYPRHKNSGALDREKDLQDVFTNILRHADSEKKIRSVAIPMFGIDPEEEKEVQIFSLVFVKTYKQFCDEKLKEGSKNPLEVIVVCHTDAIFKVAQKTCAEFVLKLKDSYQTESLDGAVGNDQELSSTNKEGPSSLGDCVICMDAITNPKTIQCGHTFCSDCIDQQFQYKKQCPTCGTVCGIITGDQPEGTMKYSLRDYTHLPGFEKCGSIIITYNFPDGRQEDHHPSPGTWYKGITRSAYLPNNDEGRKILEMLKIAFKRKVTFTIGNSRTTGQQGVITWNDIHHKTDHRPYTQFGYPDPTYLERVKDELAAKGITEDDIEKN